MARYVVLLRGINVGGQGKLPMAQLRALCADAGGGHVATYIQSGNAVLTSEAAPEVLAAELGARIEAAAGFAPEVLVRTVDELEAVIAGNPFPEEADPTKLVVAFLRTPPAPGAFDAVDLAAFAPEEAVLGDRHLYLHLPDGQGRAKLPIALGRAGGVAATARNWRTVTVLAEMAAALPS